MGNNKFILNEKNGVKYYTIPSFDETGLIKHMFTTRIGGVSPKPYDSLNLGFNLEDEKENVLKNYKIVSDVMEVSLDSCVLSDQTHGTNIRIVTKEDAGKGIVRQKDYKSVDGLLTDIPGLTIFTFYADCVPIFYLDKVKKVVGLAHGGWRGTVEKIAGKMIDKMIKVYGSRPEDILIGIGPSIGPCCYEVSEDVFKRFNENFTNTRNMLKKRGSSRWMLNLWEANREALKEKGIKSRNITISNLCTSCNNDIFYSYRKEKGKTGRMAAIIQLV
ncbi:peptidoglycan editing factor PgeF [Thermohalobacter berrensis]|uniref:Purine nucleoside phosphorylase n=1 Tax=Thermohalobacter berrensis TaxID=99594 RepID=A0A419TA14_9FIRM|nr:peptidoglycan editing factor PgeF [Thermohalobacter berrensis]RKD34312.1 polyphenol oxidase [Thermohalobacter berrensis]